MSPKRTAVVARVSNKETKIDPGQFQACEPRIALSATAGAAWWEAVVGEFNASEDIGGIDQESVHQTPDNTIQPAPPAVDLFSQARRVRQSTGLSGSGQTAVVIDTGIAPDHVTLGGENRFGPGGRVVGGFDFAENDLIPYDDGPAGFHGTAIASVLGGNSTDGGSFQGIAPDVDLVALRVFDDNGRSNLQWIEAALQWVHDNRNSFDSPITTVNLSIGIGLDPASSAEAALVLADELEQLRQDDILVFAAAGNFYEADSPEAAVYPASDPNVFAVSSIDTDGNLSNFSQRPDGALAAVGRDVNSAVPDHVFGWDGNVNDFASLDGSSLATPQIAGVAIVLRQALQEAGLPSTADDVLQALTLGASTTIDPVSGSSYQSVDLEGSLAFIAESLIANSTANRDTIVDSVAILPIDPLDFSGNSRNELNLGDLSSLVPDADGVYRLDGGDGADSLSLVGGDATERYILRAGADQISEIAFDDVRIELIGFEQFTVNGSGGDRVSLFDTRGNDTLRTSQELTTLEGVGYSIEIQGVREIYVHATAGGNDRAFLSDTAGDDTLVVRPEFTSIRSSADEQSGDRELFRLAFGFEDVSVASTGSGNDRVEIFDSVGDDTLSLSPGRSVLVGPGYRVSAVGFDDTVARASNSGNEALSGRDTVRVFLDDEDDLLLSDFRADGRARSVGIAGNVSVRAEGFDQTEAFVRFEPLDLADWLDRRRG